MQLLLTSIPILLAGVLVVLVPGAALLALTRLDRIVHPPLVPAAALALGIVPLFAVTAATLALRQPIEVALGLLALFVLGCWSALARRERSAERRDAHRGDAGPGRLHAWARPVADLVAGDWLRGTPVAALGISAVAGCLAIWVGAHAWNDSLYHIGQAQKLLALDSPSFSNTLQYADGAAHPGYLVPVWQEALAMVARVAGVNPVTAAWVLPGLTFAIATLTVGGLGWALTRARHATTIVSLAWLLATVAMLPSADFIVNAMHPGIVAIGVLVPLVFAMLLTALWPDRDVTVDAATPRTVTRAATFVAAVALAGIGTLHVGYLWVVGLGVLGYFLGWGLRAPWPRAVVVRHLTTGLAVLLVAGACIALLLPGLSRQEGLGRDAQEELQVNESELYEGENGANLDALLRGGTEHFHLRADYLVLAGGLALMGLLAIPLTLLAPRWPGGWYLAGAALLVLGIALVDALFPALVRVVTLDQARRIDRVLPLVPGLGIAALAVGAGTTGLWQRGKQGRVLGALLAVAAAAGLALLVGNVPPLGGYGGDEIVPPWVLYAVLVVLALGAALQLALLVRRVAARRGAGPAAGSTPDQAAPGRRTAAQWEWPTALVGRGSATVAALVLLVGAAPVYGNIGDVVEEGRIAGVSTNLRTAEMRLFQPLVATRLRDLPVGSVVLADPRSNTRDAYIAMAVAPVYVVSSVPRHTALMPENRVEERFRTAVSFFEGSPPECGTPDPGLSERARLQLLLDEHVDAIVMNPRSNAFVIRMLSTTPGIAPVRFDDRIDNQRMWLVDRDELRAGLPSGCSKQRMEAAAAGS